MQAAGGSIVIGGVLFLQGDLLLLGRSVDFGRGSIVDGVGLIW